MGRKIPGRKHHGVRDPEKQRAERLKSLKYKINAPPSDPDNQEVPRSVQRIAELAAKVKNGDFERKKPKQPRRKELFEQHPNECDRTFLLRVNRYCNEVKREAAFEKKYGVEIRRNSAGEVEVKKRAKDPLQIMLKEERKKKINGENKLTKVQKRKLKLAEKKKKKLENQKDDFGELTDNVKFGEQAHAPPTLVVPKKSKSSGETPRPGRKNLLLKSMLQTTPNKVIDRTGKRKDLPNAVRRQLDKQQQDVIQAYRSLKRKNTVG